MEREDDITYCAQRQFRSSNGNSCVALIEVNSTTVALAYVESTIYRAARLATFVENTAVLEYTVYYLFTTK